MSRNNSCAFPKVATIIWITTARWKQPKGLSLRQMVDASATECLAYTRAHRMKISAPGLPLAGCIVVLMPHEARAATMIEGAAMKWPFALPFAGLILSIALGPLLIPNVWHRHYGKIAAGWSLVTLLSLSWFAGISVMFASFVHAMLSEYLSFILLLFGLYTVAGGILVTGGIKGTPWNNTAILALGTAVASVVGTTGAAMILIRPLIRANISRRHSSHVIVFFIILVGNVGGALSPLGDPPLLVGFLHGVDFFWTTRNLWIQTALLAALLLVMFVAVDIWCSRGDSIAPSSEPIRIRGQINLVLIAAILPSIFLFATWRPGIALNVFGTELKLQNLVRDGLMGAIAV